MYTWLNVESHDPFMTKTQATCEGLEKNPKKGLGEARGRMPSQSTTGNLDVSMTRIGGSVVAPPNKAQKHQVAGDVRSGPSQWQPRALTLWGNSSNLHEMGETRELERWLRC